MTYRVKLQPSEKQFIVEGEHSILEAATREKIHLAHSCRDGSCGVCKSKLLQGKVKQPDDQGGISDIEVAQGYILTCVAKPISDIEIETAYFSELDGIDPRLYPCKVQSINFPAHDVAIIRLRMPPDVRLQYLPGQYIELIFKDIRRSYSIANIPQSANHIELHIRHVKGGAFSDMLFTNVREETMFRLYGPHGTFFVRDSKRPIVFLAGGTGFAPVKAMVEQLIETNSERRIHIYWGARSIEGFYTDVANNWCKTNSNVRYTPVLSSEESNWQGRRGLVHRAVLEDFPDLGSYEVYASGSPDMITAAKNDFINIGLLEKNFYADAFTAFKQKI